jgi:hypothetical protein
MSTLRFARLAGLWLLVGTSLSINLLQALHIRALQAAADEKEVSGELSAGSAAPPLDVLDIEGHRARIEYGGPRQTILYVFSPSCEWCERNSAAVESLAAQTADRYRLIGLSLSDRGIEQDYSASVSRVDSLL